MFKTLRNARARTAANYTGVFVVATVLGTGVAAADPKLKTVMLDNGFPVDVKVTYEGYSKMPGSFHYKAAGTNFRLGDIPEGTTLTWTASPEPGQLDKSTFTKCTGNWKITSSTNKVVLAGGCDHKATADIEVTLNNNLSERVYVTVSGTDKPIKAYPAYEHTSHPVGKAKEGTAVAWSAESTARMCSGEIRVGSSSKTITVDATNCPVKSGAIHNGIGKPTTWRISVKNDGPDEIDVHVVDLFDDKRTDLDSKKVHLKSGESGPVEVIHQVFDGVDEAHVQIQKVIDKGRDCGDERLVKIRPGDSIHVKESGQEVIRTCKITKQ
jgi:hypothetical protein